MRHVRGIYLKKVFNKNFFVGVLIQQLIAIIVFFLKARIFEEEHQKKRTIFELLELFN